jgi:hypothetical protein
VRQREIIEAAAGFGFAIVGCLGQLAEGVTEFGVR